ncbi:MAG: hypothetical protein K2L08_06275 [Erysipelotrichaceae bacterium]|nr:hypothetical protein [Erysipelotrichaceae bacterium]
MKIQDLDKEEVLQAARKQFPDYEIEIDTTDLFTYDLEEGKYQAPFYEKDIYISTRYAYEDIMVNGNATRYKIQITTIMLLKHTYEIIYQTKGRYYVAYEKEGEIFFHPYEEFFMLIKDQMKKIDEK